MTNFCRSIIFIFLACFSLGYAQAEPASSQKVEVSYVRDAKGNIVKIKTPHAGEINYLYDPLNRPIVINFPDGKQTKYTYNHHGDILEMIDFHGKTTFSYDVFNRLTKVELTDSPPIFYESDSAGKILKITYPDKEDVCYEYDDKGCISAIVDKTGKTKYEFDFIAKVVKEILPNGIITTYQYDDSSRPSKLSHKKSDGTLIAEYTYTYDDKNRLISLQVTDAKETKETKYSYDALNRLIAVDCSDKTFEKYTYDEAGNRLTKITEKGTINYQYDNHNRLVKANKTLFYYDAAGNLIKKISPEKESVYAYDAENKLISYLSGKDKVTFEYDGEGRRISKTVNGNKIIFVNDYSFPTSRILLEKDSAGKTQKRYIYSLFRLGQQSSAGTTFFLYERHGRNVAFLTDEKGALLERYTYDAFGCKEGKSGNNNYLYDGEEYDKETGLIFLSNRYYDPETGRFISIKATFDAVSDTKILNTYPFVENDPINHIDRSGGDY